MINADTIQKKQKQITKNLTEILKAINKAMNTQEGIEIRQGDRAIRIIKDEKVCHNTTYIVGDKK